MSKEFQELIKAANNIVMDVDDMQETFTPASLRDVLSSRDKLRAVLLRIKQGNQQNKDTERVHS